MENLKIVCFRWGDQYSEEHVNRLYRGVANRLRIPHQFILITDNPSRGRIDPGVLIIPLWDKCRELGRCYNRLFVFSAEMERYIGKRFVCIDLDCVITGDITPLLDRTDDFVIHAYQPHWNPKVKCASDQRYNGGMFLMDAGARRRVWESFDAARSPAALRPFVDAGQYVGSDQAWIRHVLGPDEKRWGPHDGVYEARNVMKNLPPDSRIVFFAGNRDPMTADFPWVKRLYA